MRRAIFVTLLVPLCGIALCDALHHTVQGDDAPSPALERVRGLGCTVELITLRYPASGTKPQDGWKVHVWADYRNSDQHPASGEEHDWNFLLSIREKRSKALQDCDRWMDEIGKKMNKQRPTK